MNKISANQWLNNISAKRCRTKVLPKRKSQMSTLTEATDAKTQFKETSI